MAGAARGLCSQRPEPEAMPEWQRCPLIGRRAGMSVDGRCWIRAEPTDDGVRQALVKARRLDALRNMQATESIAGGGYQEDKQRDHTAAFETQLSDTTRDLPQRFQKMA
jgi:hypothetical protein